MALVLSLNTTAANASNTSSIKDKNIKTLLNKHNDTLLKAKKEWDWKQMAISYRSVMFLSEKKLWNSYADSILKAAQMTTDNKLLGMAYLTKGIIKYDEKKYSQALNYYLLADNAIVKTNDQYTKYKIKYSIGHTKYYLGYYHEAIALFTDCLNYFQNENDLAHLNTIHSLALCYNKLKNYEKSRYYNNLGLKFNKEYGYTDMQPHFLQSVAINDYCSGKYDQALSQLKKGLSWYKKKNDFANEALATFYIGKCYWSLKQYAVAVPYFKKVDEIITKNHYIKPELRESYEYLIDYSHKQNDTKNELHYINKLMKIDVLLHANYRYLSSKIHKEYDTKKLELAKQEIEQSLNNNRKIGAAIITILLLAIVVLYKHHLNNKKRMKQKFDEYIKEQTSIPKIRQPFPQESCDDLNPQLVQTILKNLEKFEANHKYIEKDMSLSKLAAHLKTNNKYAYKIILAHRGKKTIEYITDLKIDYIVTLLKTQNKYRNYTNKALGEEAGFGSTQIFTKAFNQKMGMSPTFFIQELKKSHTCNSNI